MDDFLNNLTGSLSQSFGQASNAFNFAQQRATAFADAMDPQGDGGNKGAPPVAHKALRQLPTITVAPEDLVDENNRECCICLEENHLKDRVLRLPCAHIFHQRCIIDWLTKHCTCPVCRYELETEDAQYEKHRKARMKARKPRVHRYELERMPLPDLKQMAKENKIKWPRRVTSKEDIVDAFLKSDRVDVIAAPKPVEYELQVLRDMGVGKLKRTMEAAGVFFDPIDVVEKDDMVRIFCNSGRLVLLPDTPREEEVGYDEFDIEPEYDRKPAAVDPIATPPPPPPPPMETDPIDPPASRNGLTVETVADKEEGPQVLVDATCMFEGYEDEIDTSRGVVEEVIPEEDEPEVEVNQDSSTPGVAQESSAQASIDDEPTVPVETEVDTADDSRMAADYALFESYSIADLRRCAQNHNVDLSHCIERSEMVDKLVRARNGRVSAADFEQWSVSQLWALATAVDADLSHCRNDRNAMIQALVQESRARPHVANYLDSLMPLARLPVSQLRAVAREWRVNVNDCIEKEEMIHRLLKAAVPAAAGS